jgi:hypothetical protein
VDRGDLDRRRLVVLRLRDDQVGMTEGSDLREVRHAEDLMALTEDGKFTADLGTDFSANIGVDLVED